MTMLNGDVVHLKEDSNYQSRLWQVVGRPPEPEFHSLWTVVRVDGGVNISQHVREDACEVRFHASELDTVRLHVGANLAAHRARVVERQMTPNGILVGPMVNLSPYELTAGVEVRFRGDVGYATVHEVVTKPTGLKCYYLQYADGRKVVAVRHDLAVVMKRGQRLSRCDARRADHTRCQKHEGHEGAHWFDERRSVTAGAIIKADAALPAKWSTPALSPQAQAMLEFPPKVCAEYRKALSTGFSVGPPGPWASAVTDALRKTLGDETEICSSEAHIEFRTHDEVTIMFQRLPFGPQARADAPRCQICDGPLYEGLFVRECAAGAACTPKPKLAPHSVMPQLHKGERVFCASGTAPGAGLVTVHHPIEEEAAALWVRVVKGRQAAKVTAWRYPW